MLRLTNVAVLEAAYKERIRFSLNSIAWTAQLIPSSIRDILRGMISTVDAVNIVSDVIFISVKFAYYF
jgi:hypothetical protein